MIAVKTEREARPQDAASTDSGRPRVLFIGGFGRSGSTLLERVLGQVPGVCDVGEVVHLWQRGLLEGQLCGCGAKFHDCPFWARVGQAAFGGWEGVDGEASATLQRAVDRTRYIPALITRTAGARYRRDLTSFTAERLGPLYRAIADVSGASVIVDASKHASSAYVLRSMPSLDLRVVHLVRDSHGVAYSWTKRVRRPELAGSDAFMPRYHPAAVGVQWAIRNSLFHGLGRLGVPTLFVRYEAFVGAPRQELLRILDFAGVGAAGDALSFLHDGHVDLGPTHSVSGNPMRFRHGEVALAVDEAWKDQMRPQHRRLVSLATWPLLRHYGYLSSDRRGP